MKFVWDENKRRINRQKHDLDFADANIVFAGVTVTFQDSRNDYGEERFITIGMLGFITVVIAHTEAPNEIRVISMRKANIRERKAYEETVCF